MNKQLRLVGLGLAALGAVWSAGQVGAQTPAPKGRDPRVVGADAVDLERAIWRDRPGNVMFDPAKRSEMQAKAVPALNKLLGLIKEMFSADPKADENPVWIVRYLGTLSALSALGDADATRALDVQSMSDNRTAALYGKLGKFLAAWYSNIKNEKELEKLLTEAKALASKAPKDEVVGTIFTWTAWVGYKYPEALRDKLEGIIVEDLKSEAAKRWKIIPRLGFRYSVLGTQVNRKAFDSSTLKGKVVVVYFWCTLDARYRDHVTKLAELYKKLPAGEVEFVGVCLDDNRRLPEGYLQGHPEITWPQLYDESAKGANPLVSAFGFLPISNPVNPPLLTMTIIDKDGRYRGSKFSLESLAAEIKNASVPLSATTRPTATQPGAHTQPGAATKKAG